MAKVLRKKAKKEAGKPVKGRRVRRKRVKSLDELIKWQAPVGGPSWVLTFDPVEVPLRLLPRDVREHYTFHKIDLDSAAAYPGRPSKKGKVYFIVVRKDGLREAWHFAPSPSLRNVAKYWQKDRTIKFYKPWPY